MTTPIPPARPPLPALALALAEAALQRQSRLTGADRAGAPGAAPPPATETAGPPLPAAPDRVSLSPQARQALDSAPAPATTPAAPSAPGSTAHAATPLRGPPAPSAAPLTATPQQPRPAAAAPASAAGPLPPGAWPASGVSAPVQALMTALVRDLTRATVPQRVLAVQPWPAELMRLLEGAGDAPATRDGAALPALQTWLVHQGMLQTPEGARSFALRLKLPASWLQQQTPPAAAPQQGSGAPTLAFAGRPQDLLAGAFALVLQSTASAARTSALLVMEFAPQAQASVYGRELLQARQDPWLQMAVLQASGQLPRDDDLARDQEAERCQAPGCPYAGRACCPQPFCPALRVVNPVAAVDGAAADDHR